ncbi:MAG: PVC-type heme-binding CxxCH protein [Pirellulaceae bacterium]
MLRHLLCLATCATCLADASAQDMTKLDLSRAGNEKVAEIMKTYGGRGVMADESDPTSPKQAVSEFMMRDGMRIELVASEPEVSQPLFLSWDSRGRMWVVHYRQYQFPAGLKVVRYDQHLRAVFDKVPDPPPLGTPGLDKITVHSDTDGDGIYDTQKDVITGLNIASSVAIGRGGIWVLNPPYLLFYPDADRDDVPDSDPVVHLSGFGLQDTHSVANSLMFGPDGWLYGSNGSTTVGDVSSAVTKGVRFQGQCVWRYHPGTKEFEVYAEGGGNTFSLDIDSKGRVFTGTNGGNTRGWYFPQGSYSEKNWGKHGPLTNPYAFGFFPPMRFKGDGRRFPQAFCIYEGGLFPSEYDGDVIAPNAMQNLVWDSDRIPDGSTYRTEDQPNLVETSDRWFRPVYSGVGPDGAVYIADWYDTRLSHVSPIDDWHKESGRVYRIKPKEADAIYAEGDLHRVSSGELIEKFSHVNKWVRQRAALELGWRGDNTVVDQLVDRVTNDASLESLWVLGMMGEMNESRAGTWLSSKDPHIRRWVVRLLGDVHQSHPALADLARRETDVQVRSQLAASAKRISAADAIAVIRQLLTHDADATDPHMPLMNWWALEAHAQSYELVAGLFADADVWKLPMVREHIINRLMQRYAASGTNTDLQQATKLMQLAPDDESKAELLIGLNRAFQGRAIPQLPDGLAQALSQYQSQLGDSGLVLGVRQGDSKAIAKAVAAISNSSADLGLRLELTRVFGEIHQPTVIKALLGLATGRTDEPALQRVAIRSLGQYDDDSISKQLVAAMGGKISEEHGLRATACRTLASRTQWAKDLLEELTAWRLRREHIPPDVVQNLRNYDDPEIVAAVQSVFGKTLNVASPEKIVEMKRLKAVVGAAPGDAVAGREHFSKRCANCHQLFGEGKKVGPPLDGYERGKVEFWLTNFVDPSLEIREGFQSYLLLTSDGRALTGMIAAQDPKTVTLRNADNQTMVISRDDIENLKALPTSLMPDDVLKDMTNEQIQDLFAYLSLGA